MIKIYKEDGTLDRIELSKWEQLELARENNQRIKEQKKNGRKSQ